MPPTGLGNPRKTKLACLAYAAAAVLAVLAWQATTVHFNYEGNWTGLFCTGSRFPTPPELAAHTRVFPASDGYDAEFYRYIAHDPWMRRGWARYCDLPVLRYTRILIPALAWLLAFGRDASIDAAYIGLIAFWVFPGVYWLGRWIALHGRNPAWGLGFLAMPATLVSVDRLTIDVAMLALCAGVLWYSARGSTGALYAILLAAPLVRDTGLLLVAACCAYAFSKRRWGRTALFATAALPAFGWFAYVWAHLPVKPHGSGSLRLFEYPVVGPFAKLFSPQSYPFSRFLTHLTQTVDVIALSGFLVMFSFAIWSLRYRPYGLEQWLTAAFIVLAIAFSRPSYWGDFYSYGRVMSPLILLVATRSLLKGPTWLLVAVLMVDLRIGLQWGPQILGILRGLT